MTPREQPPHPNLAGLLHDVACTAAKTVRALYYRRAADEGIAISASWGSALPALGGNRIAPAIAATRA
jgi:hypothetical protein